MRVAPPATQQYTILYVICKLEKCKQHRLGRLYFQLCKLLG